MWIHGGGWHSGDKADLSAALLKKCNERGIAVAAVNFRQAPAVDVRQSLADLRLALSYLRVRSNRIAVMGGSSGGHLASMLGLTEAHLVAVVDKCGPSDLTLGGANPIQLWTVARAFGHLPGAALRDRSPVYRTHPGAPPFFILHGDKHPLVPVSQSRALAQRLRAARVPVRLIMVHNADHEMKAAGGTASLSESQIADGIADWVRARFFEACSVWPSTGSRRLRR